MTETDRYKFWGGMGITCMGVAGLYLSWFAIIPMIAGLILVENALS